MNFKLCPFLMIILIVSITPVSSAMMNERYEGTHSNMLIMENRADTADSLSVIDQDLDELDDIIFGLNQSVAYVVNRSDDFGWKFWKWPGITDDIGKTASKINIDANKCKKIISKIKKHVSNLKLGKERFKLSSEDNPYINNVGNSFCQDDAQYMASELTKALNSTFTVQNISASGLREGDIIQYLSEGKYPRYLKVQKIESSNTNTQKILQTTPINIPTGHLEGTGDKIVEVPLIGTVICLAQPSKVNTSDTLNTTVGIQQNSIDTSREKGEKLEKKAGRIDNSIDALIGLDKFMATVILVSGFVALDTGFVSPPALSAELIIIVFAVLAFTISVILLELNSMYNDLSSESHELIADADSCETDLNTYTAAEEKTNIFMNITTFDGIPVIKQPPLNGWKNFTFIRIADPQHGDLLPGPGLQFLYGPNEGYTGKDWFKFQYTDNYGRVKGNITVNILVSPIPVFNISTFNRTLRGVVS